MCAKWLFSLPGKLLTVLLGGAQLKGHLLQVLFDHFHLGWPSLRYFSSCPLVKTQSFIAGGAGSILGWETKIPYAAGCGQKLIKPEKNVFIFLIFFFIVVDFVIH